MRNPGNALTLPDLGGLGRLGRETLRGQLTLLLLAPVLMGAIVWLSAKQVSFLLAHTLAELFSIIVAANAWAVATAAHRFTRNHFVVFVSVAIGWAAGLDLIHTLVYEGMTLMPQTGLNYSAQLWVTARLIQAAALVVAPVMLSRQVPVAWLHVGFGAINGFAVLAFFGGWLPDAFVEGQGLTPLKINLEYLIIGLLALALALLWWRRHLTTPRLLWGMSAALVMMMLMEFAFTQYASASTGGNLYGHILKVFAYWFIWVALVETNLKDPFSLLARAASTYDAVPDPTLIVLANGTIRQANRAAGTVAKQDPVSLAGQSSHELFHDPRVAQTDCPVCSRLWRGVSFTQVLALPQQRFVECSVTPFAETAERNASVEVVRDITQERRAQLELAEYRQGLERRVQERTAELEAMTESLNRSNAERQAVFDAANVGIVLKRDHVVQRCNRTMERLFGYGPDELFGQTTRRLYPDDASYEDVTRRVLASLHEVGSFTEERELVRKDGSRFWCRITDAAIDRDDLSKGVAGTFEDTSTEHEAMAEMARARALAEDLARTKSEFLANMSHEIRTPMNSVIGMTHLALKAEPSPRVRDYLEKIQAAGRHLLSVINDILDFSKLEARKMALSNAGFRLGKVLDDVASLLAAKAADKGLALVVDVSPGIPANLTGDALRLEQVLINLASNAVKFTERGQVTISVREQARQGDEIVLRFEVADTGIGITPEQGQRLFQSFQQGDASTTRRYGGSGLGLIISKRLAELMGGEIGMRSEPGVGSTFWFTARLKRDDPAAPECTASAVQALATTPVQLAGARALVVEDNAFNQQVAAEFLQALGLQVDVAENGAVGLERVRQGSYDIVLMDMLMPVMDGLDATRAIRKLPGRAHLPILALTANAMAEDRERCIAAGMDDHIAKPIDPEDLRATLLKWVKRLEPLEPLEPNRPKAAAVDPADWPRVRDTLLGLLRDDDAASLRYLSEHREILRASLGEHFQEVADAVGNFDFSTALARLQ